MQEPEPLLGGTDDLDRWIESTVPRALAYALTLVPNRAEAEDLVHDCYGRLLARAEEYDLAASGTRLLFKAITNAAINWTQRRTRTESLEIEGGERSEMAEKQHFQPDQQAMQRELELAVVCALKELSVTQRAVVELRSLGHSLLEIAEMLTISHANARTLLHRGREKMAVRLRGYIEERVK